MKWLWALFAILVILNLQDFAITAMLISKAGVEVELNPFLRSLVISAGVSAILIIKAFFLSLLGYAMYLMGKDSNPNVERLGVALFLLNLIMLGVVSWGIYCIL